MKHKSQKFFLVLLVFLFSLVTMPARSVETIQEKDLTTQKTENIETEAPEKEGKLEKVGDAFKKAGRGIKEGAVKAGSTIKRGTLRAGREIKKGAKKTGRAFKNAGKAFKEAFTDNDEEESGSVVTETDASDHSNLDRVGDDLKTKNTAKKI